MSRVVLQIPVSRSLRLRAERGASDLGFSSLQEIIRVFMAKLASQAISFSFEEADRLSSGAEKRYQQMLEDFKLGKNVYFAKSVDGLMDQLDGNTLPRKVSKKLP